MIESIFVRVVMKVTTKLSFGSVKLLSLKSISDLKNNLILNLTSFLNLTNNFKFPGQVVEILKLTKRQLY